MSLASCADVPCSPASLDPGDRKITIGTDVIQQDEALEATVRTAVRDLRRVGRNLDLIDDAALNGAINEETGLR